MLTPQVVIDMIAYRVEHISLMNTAFTVNATKARVYIPNIECVHRVHHA